MKKNINNINIKNVKIIMNNKASKINKIIIL